MDKYVLLGVGNVAKNVVRCLEKSCTIYGTTRDEKKIHDLTALGIQPLLIPSGNENPISPAHAVRQANVLVSFPPDGTTDRVWANHCRDARRIIYISSTGVYGNLTGKVNEESPVDVSNPNSAQRLEAERIWKDLGATVLRCPGLYGPESGMHLRLNEGTIKIPGEGKNYISRIHLHDLARIIVEIFNNGTRESLYVVGDLSPSPYVETVSYVCEKMNLALPESVNITDVSPTLRGDRQIDASKLLQELNIQLRYPTFREGYDSILSPTTSGLEYVQ